MPATGQPSPGDSPNASLGGGQASLRELFAVFLVALLALLAVQHRTGARERELAFHPDEPAHFVTGVMVSEYLREGAPTNPLRFAEQYYVRYPRLALGHWPPLFPAMLGGWLLLFGSARFSVFALMALLGAATALLLYLLIRRGQSAWIAAAGVVWWILFQTPTQTWVSSVMTEIPLTLFCLAAVLSYIRYLENPGPRPALSFGLAAAAALLVKALGIVLIFVPTLAVAAIGRWALIRRWDYWLPAGVVLLLAGPWYALQGALIPTAFGGSFDRLALKSLVSGAERAEVVLGLLGPVPTAALAGAFMWMFLRPALWGRCSPKVAVTGAYAAGALTLHALLPESAEPRHLFHLIPVGIAVAAWISAAFATRLPRLVPSAAKAALVAVALGRLLWPAGWPDRPDYGLIQLAEEIAADPSLDGAVLLVSAHGTAEGALIAETARLAPDPRWFVLRASKTLAWMNWNANGHYRTYYESAVDAAAFLDSIPVALVVFGRGQFRELPHERALREAIEANPDRWRRVTDRLSSNRPFQAVAYRSNRADVTPHGPIRIDMGPRLGRVLEAQPIPSMRSIVPQ
jgi:hypothetical protein